MEVKSCFRCGAEFTQPGRVCLFCRKPRPKGRPEILSRTLTFREKQLTALVQTGKLNKEIAAQLHLTEGTVKEYLNRIYRKLQLRNRTELAVWSMAHLDMVPGIPGSSLIFPTTQ